MILTQRGSGSKRFWLREIVCGLTTLSEQHTRLGYIDGDYSEVFKQMAGMIEMMDLSREHTKVRITNMKEACEAFSSQ